VIFADDSHLREIGEEAFSCSGIEKIAFPSNVEIIGKNCFCQCTSLKEVIFAADSHLREIREWACKGSGIEKVVIPSAATYDATTFPQGCVIEKVDAGNAEDQSKAVKNPSPELTEAQAKVVEKLEPAKTEDPSKGVEKLDAEKGEDPSKVVDKLEQAKAENPSKLMDFSSFTGIRRIGKGGSGYVELWEDADKSQLAIKFIAVGDDFDWDHFDKEVWILVNACDHPCLLSIVGWCGPVGVFGPRIATEYMKNGSLADILTAVKKGTPPGFWTHTNIAKFIVGLVSGLRHLHCQDIVHCDLKPANLLVCDDGTVKIGDFGSAKMVNCGLTASTAAVMTPLYGAPELFEMQRPTEKVDIWSFGLILYEILFGETVFPATANLMQMPKLLESYRPKLDSKGCGFLLKMIIEKCWSVKPADRPTIEELESGFQGMGFNFFNGVEPAVDASAVGAYLSGLS
jgi:hypothetical protein